jgi:hypothetical protein
MKAGPLFWGVALIVTGLLLVLDMTGAIDGLPINPWAWWPVLLILAGLAVLSKQAGLRLVLAAAAGLTAGALVYDVFSLGFVFGRGGPERTSESQEYAEPFTPGTERASLRLEGGAMKVTLDGTTDHLVHAMTRSSHGEFLFDRSGDSTAPEVAIRWEGGHGRARISRFSTAAEVKLNPAPVWDVTVEAGASRIDLDLSPFAVGEVRIETGAASVEVKLGDRQDEARVRVESGVSSVELEVPSSVGCEVKFDGGLASKRLSGFEKEADGVYRTPGFAEAAKKITVDANVGLSSLRVRRY